MKMNNIQSHYGVLFYSLDKCCSGLKSFVSVPVLVSVIIDNERVLDQYLY